MQKNKIKVFIIPIIALSMFTLLLFGAGYAYYTSSSTMNTAYGNVVMPLRTTLSCVKQDASIAISYNNMYSNKAGSVVGTNTAYVNCTCSGAVGSTCDYSVYFGESATAYEPSANLNSSKEFTAKVTNPTGCTAKNGSNSETQVNTLRDKIVSTCSLTIPSAGTISANVGVELKWYNTDLVQDSHAQKVYTYKLKTQPVIPSTYQPVEYIQSNGSQYIDTGFKPTPNTTIETSFKYTSTTVQQRLFGISTSTSISGELCYDFYINGNGIFARAYNNNVGDWTPTSVHADTKKHYLLMDGKNKKITLDGYTSSLPSYVSNNGTANLPIFARYALDTSSYMHYSNIILYYFTIYDNGVLIRDFIPVKRVSDNAAGLYDLANGVFYTASGLTAGPNA